MVFTLYWLFGLLFNRKTSVSGLVNIHHKPIVHFSEELLIITCLCCNGVIKID